jgi:hypothetical protein
MSDKKIEIPEEMGCLIGLAFLILALGIAVWLCADLIKAYNGWN